jgi:ribose transport system substrate-binding protein
MEPNDSPFELGRISRRESLRWGLIGAGGLLAPGVLAACGSDEKGAGTQASVAGSGGKLERFDPNAAAGSAPDLPKVIGVPGAYDIPESIALLKQMELAAASRGVDFQSAVANGDIQKEADHIQQMLARGVGALMMYPFNEQATRSFVQQALDKGICVFGVGRPFSTVQQIENRRVQGIGMGRAAAKWIRENAGGKAKAVVFDDSKLNPPSIPYHKALLAELKKAGEGVEIIEVPDRGDPEKDANAFASILQAHPDVNVVMGNPVAAPAAFSVLDAKGMGSSPDLYLSVQAGGDDVLAKVASGRSTIKTTLGIAWPVMAYGIGLMAADWLAGKSVPRLIDVRGGGTVITTPEEAATWRRDMNNAGDTWNNRRDTYVELWGNINYDQRENYWREAVTDPAKAKA